MPTSDQNFGSWFEQQKEKMKQDHEDRSRQLAVSSKEARSRFYLERYAEVFQEALTAFMYTRQDNEDADPIGFASEAAGKMIADMRELEAQLSSPVKPTTASMQAETARIEELMNKMGGTRASTDPAEGCELKPFAPDWDGLDKIGDAKQATFTKEQLAQRSKPPASDR